MFNKLFRKKQKKNTRQVVVLQANVVSIFNKHDEKNARNKKQQSCRTFLKKAQLHKPKEHLNGKNFCIN